jgi:hypothetical protein
MVGAIVTLVVGDGYRAKWEKYCKPNWEAYALKHQLELIVLSELPDQSESGLARPANWQKLLIGRSAQVRQHKHVLWIDADVVINVEAAPNIFDGIPPGKVGAVRTAVFFENPLFAGAFHRIVGNFASAEEYRQKMFVNAGMTAVRPYLDTGVLAFADFDLGFLDHLYAHYRDLTITYEEQIPLSHELAKAGLIHEVDPRFNVEWYCQKYSVYDFANKFLPEMKRLYIAQALSASYFLHFCGNQQDMSYLDSQITINPGQVVLSIDALEAIAGQLLKGLPEERREALLAKIRNQNSESNPKPE